MSQPTFSPARQTKIAQLTVAATPVPLGTPSTYTLVSSPTTSEIAGLMSIGGGIGLILGLLVGILIGLFIGRWRE